MTQSPSPQHSQIWSIGIYTGESPVSLRPSPNVQNPVLTHAHVTDIAASFVADPFMVHENDGYRSVVCR